MITASIYFNLILYISTKTESITQFASYTIKPVRYTVSPDYSMSVILGKVTLPQKREL